MFILKVARMGLRSLRRRRSQSWPWAKTTIEGNSVELVLQSRGSHRVYELSVSYSYSVNGEKHGGTYTELFDSESEAQGALKSLQELPPPARYKPSNPGKSIMDPYRDAALGLRVG